MLKPWKSRSNYILFQLHHEKLIDLIFSHHEFIPNTLLIPGFLSTQTHTYSLIWCGSSSYRWNRYYCGSFTNLVTCVGRSNVLFLCKGKDVQRFFLLPRLNCDGSFKKIGEFMWWFKRKRYKTQKQEWEWDTLWEIRHLSLPLSLGMKTPTLQFTSFLI